MFYALCIYITSGVRKSNRHVHAHRQQSGLENLVLFCYQRLVNVATGLCAVTIWVTMTSSAFVLVAGAHGHIHDRTLLNAD
eukprot:4583734-Amphidinium_carterae.2